MGIQNDDLTSEDRKHYADNEDDFVLLTNWFKHASVLHPIVVFKYGKVMWGSFTINDLHCDKGSFMTSTKCYSQSLTNVHHQAREMETEQHVKELEDSNSLKNLTPNTRVDKLKALLMEHLKNVCCSFMPFLICSKNGRSCCSNAPHHQNQH